MRCWQTVSPAETRELGRDLQSDLGDDATVLLVGDLGSGKTVLTQGIAAGLGIDPAEVQSPTFTLVREHDGAGGRLVHIDLYRLDPEDLPAVGLDDYLAQRAVKVIEWADRLPWRPVADLHLELNRLGDSETRQIRECPTTGPS